MADDSADPENPTFNRLSLRTLLGTLALASVFFAITRSSPAATILVVIAFGCALVSMVVRQTTVKVFALLVVLLGVAIAAALIITRRSFE